MKTFEIQKADVRNLEDMSIINLFRLPADDETCWEYYTCGTAEFCLRVLVSKINDDFIDTVNCYYRIVEK
jgi:hypothetical protein